MRKSFTQGTVVHDSQAIPDDQSFDYVLPCGIAHPQLCAHRDAAFLRSARDCAKNLRYYLESRARGSHHSLVATRSDGSTEIRHFVLAHYRGAGPRLALLVEAIPGQGAEMNVLGLDQTCGDWNYMHDITFVGLAFRVAIDEGKRVETMQAIPRSYNHNVPHLDGCRATVLHLQVQQPVLIFPYFWKDVSASDTLEKDLASRALLKSLQASRGKSVGPGARLRRSRRRPGCMRFVLPPVAPGDGPVVPAASDSDATVCGSASEVFPPHLQ